MTSTTATAARPKSPRSVVARRLAGRLEERKPEIAAGINGSAGRSGYTDRKMNVAIVPASHDQSCLAGHAGVDSGLTEAHAVGAILRRSGDTANHVAWVDILERELRLALLKIIFDFLLEKNADVSKALVPGRVGSGSFNEILAGALGNDDDGVPALHDSLSELFEQAVITLEREGHFGNKHAIGIAAGDGG